MDEYRGLRQAAKETEGQRERARRKARLLSNVFLALATFVFTAGLALLAAAYGVRMGLELPFQELGLLGEIAASIAPSPTAAADAAGPNPPATVDFPTPIPSATPSATPTASQTSTPTHTPTASSTPTASATPSRTPVPSRTPISSNTPSGTQIPAPTSTASPNEKDFPDCDRDGNSAFESDLLALINAERESNDLPAYDQSTRLRDAARGHSTDMACNGFFSHTGSDGSSVGDRVFAENYGWTVVGENLFGSGDTSEAAPQLAFNFWMAGSANRANILSEEFSEAGFGYIYVSDSPFGGYFTAVFANR